MVKNLNPVRDLSIYHVYFAPRGKERLLLLGEQLSQRHLSFVDRLIGIVGDAGSGKSSVIKGLLPGLELVNDDDGINPLKIMQIRDLDRSFDASTYHIDMRFQLAFTQMHEIVSFVKEALQRNRRLVIEHFDQLFPFLNIHADLMIGVGEEILVTRPGIFGPLPKDVYDIVFSSLKYRRMAHTVEDITEMILAEAYGIGYKSWRNSEVRRGFMLVFKEKPDIELVQLESIVKAKLAEGLPVSYYDEEHIAIGHTLKSCSSPRIHVLNTADVEGFNLMPEVVYSERTNEYMIVGLVGAETWDINALNHLSIGNRS